MKNIIFSSILFSLIIINTGCELVKKIPDLNNTNPKQVTTSEVVTPPVKQQNPSDHARDIDTERLKQDLQDKKIGILPSSYIVDSKYGNSMITRGKMESTYYLKLVVPDSDDKYEAGISTYYKWENNDWEYIDYKEMYFVKLDKGVENLTRDERKVKIDEYKNRPPEIVIEENTDSAQSVDIENKEEETIEN